MIYVAVAIILIVVVPGELLTARNDEFYRSYLKERYTLIKIPIVQESQQLTKQRTFINPLLVV